MLRHTIRHSDNKIVTSSNAAKKSARLDISLCPPFRFRLIATPVEIYFGAHSNRIYTNATSTTAATDPNNSIEEYAP